MDSVRQYVLSVICVVIVCGILQLLLHSGMSASVAKFLSGLIVTITVLNPLLGDDLLHWDSAFEEISVSGELAVAEGEAAAQNLLIQHIKEKTRTYILTVASQMGADVSVEVQLQKEYPNAPQTVTIKGAVSPYVKQQLAACLRQDLGIAEEDQIWIS